VTLLCAWAATANNRLDATVVTVPATHLRYITVSLIYFAAIRNI
jgi:hypothetical protein